MDSTNTHDTRSIGRAITRRLFWLLNRFFMTPVFRLGLGPFVGSPLTGYIMVLKTTGAMTGRTRYTPLNYAILDGQIYCIAGLGQAAHWYRNLRAHPDVELLLPGGALAGVAEDVSNSDERLRAVRQVLKNGGFAGFFLGFNPFTVPDKTLGTETAGLPIVRIRPVGVGNGAGDPGGWLWVISWALHVVVVWAILRRRSRRGVV